jgi:hypothetical protein
VAVALRVRVRVLCSEASKAKEFAVLTGFGVYHGQLNLTAGAASENVVSKAKIQRYPASTGDGASKDVPSVSEVPLAIGITDFHFLLLYPARLLALSKINGDIVFEQGFKERFGEMRGMVVDPQPPAGMHPLIWVFSSRCVALPAAVRAADDLGIIMRRSWLVVVMVMVLVLVPLLVLPLRLSCSFVYQLEVRQESRDVWKLYLTMASDKGVRHFKAALDYCSVCVRRNAASLSTLPCLHRSSSVVCPLVCVRRRRSERRCAQCTPSTCSPRVR